MFKHYSASIDVENEFYYTRMNSYINAWPVSLLEIIIYSIFYKDVNLDYPPDWFIITLYSALPLSLIKLTFLAHLLLL